MAAYRHAIAMNPTNGALKLNLAQLLFLKGEEQEANALLRVALKMDIDSSAQLEAQLYLLCHTDADPEAIGQATKSLLNEGARLRWDVRPNIAIVRDRDPRRAALAELFMEIMQNYTGPEQLDHAVSRYVRRVPD